MTLIEVLREALLMLDAGREHVVIVRGQAHDPLDARSEAFQVRLYNLSGAPPYCETRSWLGAQWSAWRERLGWLGGAAFDSHDVLATDWRILA